MSTSLPVPLIEKCIFEIRGHRVILDSDLARLYGVTTGRFNEQVRRNLARFPESFMFQLTYQEVAGLRSQFAISNVGRGGRRYLPYVFTEHGVIMAANILDSPTAVQASVQIVMAFVRLREMLASHKDLARRLNDLEKKYDVQFRDVFDAIRQLMMPPSSPKRRIGFEPKE